MCRGFMRTIQLMTFAHLIELAFLSSAKLFVNRKHGFHQINDAASPNSPHAVCLSTQVSSRHPGVSVNSSRLLDFIIFIKCLFK